MITFEKPDTSEIKTNDTQEIATVNLANDPTFIDYVLANIKNQHSYPDDITYYSLDDCLFVVTWSPIKIPFTEDTYESLKTMIVEALSASDIQFYVRLCPCENSSELLYLDKMLSTEDLSKYIAAVVKDKSILVSDMESTAADVATEFMKEYPDTEKTLTAVIGALTKAGYIEKQEEPDSEK